MKHISFTTKKLLLTGLWLILVAGLVFGISQVLAAAPIQTVQPSIIHPTFALRDADGNNVLESGKPISTMRTCGECHDTNFIVSHSFHADLGLKDYGQVNNGAPWDASNGTFGKWDPLTYRYLSQTGDERLDMSTAEWLMTFGERIPGGGPATTSRSGQPLTSLKPDASNPETSILDPKTGQPKPWDWKQSGVLEMDCFLCHLQQPAIESRTAEIRAGRFGWAITATLSQTGITVLQGNEWGYNPEAFNETGELKPEFVLLQAPTNSNCANCHGEVHMDQQTPLVYTGCSLDAPQTATTGQIFAAQKISFSGMNISGKNDLAYAWDVHAERALKCTDCHFSLNNPIQAQRASEDNPAHITYDPRRLGISEYLVRPNHNFARGQSAQFGIAPELKGTMRRCDSCHDASIAHNSWLPYVERHMAVLDCETCHIPQMHAPAIQSYDWTVITPAGEAISQCRGVEGQSADITDLVTGFSPIWLQRTNVDGDTSLTTYNLITSWYWVYDDANGNTRPVRLIDLQRAYLQNGAYAPDIVSVFDQDGNNRLDTAELRLDNEAKTALVQSKLQALGLSNPRIVGQVQPYSINHNVVEGKQAIRECQACHANQSRVSMPMQLASYAPGGVIPQFATATNVQPAGAVTQTADGALVFETKDALEGVYVFGHSRVNWIDWLGAAMFLGTLAGVSGHGAMRYISYMRRPKHPLKTQRVHIYEAYERFWHWLQTASIIILLFTGLVIHHPDVLGVFSFAHMVTIHNVVAVILGINAALSLFWHLTTGEIRQYIPRPRGFIDDAIVQAKFYISGIFKGEPHPFEKRRDRKLNPLQGLTYFGLLNVLLPLQGLTGILMWGVQKWPAVSDMLGGLTILAPVHSLLAWLFATFIVGHVYLTTTGATPLEATRAMITGWEEIEVHEPHAQDTDLPANGEAAEHSEEEQA